MQEELNLVAFIVELHNWRRTLYGEIEQGEIAVSCDGTGWMPKESERLLNLNHSITSPAPHVSMCISDAEERSVSSCSSVQQLSTLSFLLFCTH